MKALIEEINEKLKNILSGLESQKAEIEEALATAQEKIDEKIEEAKEYKTAIDTDKSAIKMLEKEIKGFEDDLKDLTNRFSNKDLNIILETANREISNKITEKQKEILTHKEKINEYTKKARMIKDLLINLKKDKETKKYRLDNITKAYDYYERELNRIISFSSENPDSLGVLVHEDKETVIDDKPIFDEIESFESKDTDSFDLFNSNEVEESEEENASESEDVSNLFNTEENIDFRTINETIDKEYASIFGNSDDIKLEEEPKEEVTQTLTTTEDATPKNIFDEVPAEPITQPEELESTEITNIFDAPVAEEQETIKDTTVSEPEVKSEELTNPFESVLNDENLFAELNAQGSETTNEIDSFFNSNGLDFSKFNVDDQEKLKKQFNLVNYTKVLDVLRKNNIKLDNLYSAADIFAMDSNALEGIISKLLLSGQTTQNISYVLNALPIINAKDLQDVINSYGPAIKDANITDLIIKAKHLKEIGGN